MGEPGTPRWEVADIFRHYGEAYRTAHPVLSASGTSTSGGSSAEAFILAEASTDLRTPAGFQRLLDPRYAKAWVVYAKPPFAGPAQILDSLGRYTRRVAISNHRIVEVRDGRVHASRPQ